jgi:hypothetical protein
MHAPETLRKRCEQFSLETGCALAELFQRLLNKDLLCSVKAKADR